MTWVERRALPPHWKRLRAIVLTRDQYRCQLRGPHCTWHATDVDHRVNAANGGDDGLENLQAACAPCHRAKTAREGTATRELARHPGEPHPGAITP